ncbi:MAG: LemA family protein [Provencibacterium sp.]|nr:LemA family protein [Provencibacterium sp.]
MSKGLIALIAILVVAILLAILAFGNYNSLVSLSEDVRSSQADIETQLQRRSDLIPNLVNTVKGYAAHEQEVFSAIADARAQLAGAGSIADLAEADSSLTSALNRLMVVVENYPELKSDAQYTALMDELAGTENRIAVARRDYNEQARTYNGKIRSFPTVLVAGMMGFERVDYFEASPEAQSAPQVDFGA